MKLPLIHYIDRTTGKKEIEKVYGGAALSLVYGQHAWQQFLGKLVLPSIAKRREFSRLYGWWQHQSWTKGKIPPFIAKFNVDSNEFLDPVDSFKSFNDFFIRKLKPNARPIASAEKTAIIPADGRYRFYPDISQSQGFIVKGRSCNLKALLGNAALAEKYAQGTLVMARLCPSDYHRFHFPCNGTVGPTEALAGPLYSVNPIALEQRLETVWENERRLTLIQSDHFGEVAYVEIGATNVGTIHETYQPNTFCYKGQEKGYFSFGGSALILLFEKGRLELSSDLIAFAATGLETRCLLGQPLGTAP